MNNSVGVVTGTFSKDPNDPKWNDDPDMANYKAMFAKYLPGADIADTGYLIGYRQGMLLEQLLRQCGDDLSRENILRQARSFKDLVLPTVLPGIKINTNETNSQAWTQLQLQRWTGSTWELFGEVLDGNSDRSGKGGFPVDCPGKQVYKDGNRTVSIEAQKDELSSDAADFRHLSP